MSVLTGQINPLGPLVQFKAMQSRQRVEALLRAQAACAWFINTTVFSPGKQRLKT